MSKTTKVVIIFSSILLACLIAIGVIIGVNYSRSNSERYGFGNLFGSGIEVNEEADIDLDGVNNLVIDCVSGDVDVVKSTEARVTLIGNIWTTEDVDEFLKVTRDGDTVTVKLDIDSKPFRIMNSNVDMTVYLPAGEGLDVLVDSSSGDITVSDLDFSDLRIDSTSGKTYVNDCSGDVLSLDKSSGDTNVENADFSALSIDSTSGDIEVAGTPADIKLDSISGDTELSGVSGSIDLSSTSGKVSVSVDGSAPEQIYINSTSGDVKLYLDDRAQFNLSAKATSGDISTDFEITVKGTDYDFAKSIDGKAGSGGNMITIKTTSGDIDLIKK